MHDSDVKPDKPGKMGSPSSDWSTSDLGNSGFVEGIRLTILVGAIWLSIQWGCWAISSCSVGTSWFGCLPSVPAEKRCSLIFMRSARVSLPVVALTGTFIGMVLAVQSFYQFKTIGMEEKLGGVINMSLVRELGPVLAATMLAGRVGSAMAAVSERCE